VGCLSSGKFYASFTLCHMYFLFLQEQIKDIIIIILDVLHLS